MVAFSYYGNKIRAEFQDPNFKAQKYVQFLEAYYSIEYFR